MRKITRLRYVVTIAGAGLVVLLIGSSTYASTKQRDAEYVLAFEGEDADGVGTSAEERSDEKQEAPEAFRLSAGAGMVLDESVTDMSTEGDSDNEPSAAAGESDDESDVMADEPDIVVSESAIDNEPEDVRLSAGAGTILDENSTELFEEPEDKDSSFSAGIGAILDASIADTDLLSDSVEIAETASIAAEPETYWGYTNLGIAHVDNHLNIRQEPSENGKLVGKLSKDAACEILEVDNGWAHIKSGKVEGYCSTDYLYMGEEAIARGHEVASMIAIVNTQTLKVREEPNTDCVVITLIPEGEELEVVEVMGNGWVKFLLDDEEAYVSGDYVDVEERLEKAVTLTELLYGQGVSNVRVDLVQYAKQFVGNPYVWGGASLTNGADCSGFTMSIYKKYGISLPHHAASQAQLGTKISAAEAQPGDLVFYAKNGVINHVAIYIGGGQVIHASSPKTGIKISGMNYRTIACIRRYL